MTIREQLIRRVNRAYIIAILFWIPMFLLLFFRRQDFSFFLYFVLFAGFSGGILYMILIKCPRCGALIGSEALKLRWSRPSRAPDACPKCGVRFDEPA